MITFGVFIYIVSILVSAGVDIDQFMWALRDMARKGFKFDLNKIAIKDIFASKKGILNWEYLIPGFNVLKAYERSLEYYENNNEIIDSFIKNDVVYKMNRREKHKFLKKSNKLKAFSFLAKDAVELPTMKNVTINTNEFIGEIFYQEKHGEIFISRVTGNLEGLSEEKLNSLLITAILEENFGKDAVEKFPEYEDIYVDKSEELINPVSEVPDKSMSLTRKKKM